MDRTSKECLFEILKSSFLFRSVFRMLEKFLRSCDVLIYRCDFRENIGNFCSFHIVYNTDVWIL